MFLTQDDADAVARKLKADREPGRGHEIVKFRYGGKLIFQYGIRRSSKEVSHSYIPLQMKISQKECRLFRKCDITVQQ